MDDKAALFDAHVKFAYWYVSRYFPQFVSDEDIKQEALLGLWRACETFDVNNGVKFMAYASTCIRNQILMEIRRRKKAKPVVASLEELVYRESDSVLSEFISDPESDPLCSEVMLMDFIHRLNGAEQKTLQCKLLGMTQQQSATVLGISRSGYNKRLKRCKQKIEAYMKGW